MTYRILSNTLLALIAYSSFQQPERLQTLDPSIGFKEFGQLMISLSEPEGYFDSDNFVSNEAAYLRILPALKRLDVRGGVYIGVGPDQNYSYIAHIQPKLAIIVDIRRQNALQHLYLKALFQLSSNREEYLERLFGRSLRQQGRSPQSSKISDILHRIDSASLNRPFAAQKMSEAIGVMQSWDIGLGVEDFKAVDYISRAFIESGPDIKFTSYLRAPRSHHPSYRTLLEEKDPAGVQMNYLAQEESFQVIKRLHQENRILPLVGDFGGVICFKAVGQELRRRGLEVKCFYTSNVEFYLFGSGRWNTYVHNLRSLPLAREAYIIRACASAWQPHPAQIPGYYMTTVMQSFQTFLAHEAGGKNETYWDLVTRDFIVH